MAKPFFDTDKYSREPTSPTVVAFHKAIKDRVRAYMAAGGDWNAFVFEEQFAVITADALQAIEDDFLETGYRYQGSAMISAEEQPDKYRSMATPDEDRAAVSASADRTNVQAGDRTRVGVGDNVTQFSENTVGVARFVRTSQHVLAMLESGVPDNTIAIIDDSGGTLTAPILEAFKGVICLGGTVRSHLGILCREYGIPCQMNSKIAGVSNGDTVELEATAPAKTAEAYQNNVEMTANIWKLS